MDQNTKIQKMLAAKALKREAGELVTLNPIAKAKANPTSLRFAINAKCFDCQGQDADPNVVGRIRECPITKCSLHPVRPYQS